jgi:fumarate reductase flavoprotein subunit
MIHDVVVIGAGIAGMVAARRSQQLGARVVVLDKTPRPLDPRDPGSNSRKSGGLFHAAYRDPRRWSPDDLYRDLIRKTDGQVRHELVRAWADNVLRARDFLVEEGAEIERGGDIEMQWNAIQPPMTVHYDLDWQGRGPDVLLTRMCRAFADKGGDFRSGTRACDLIMKDAHVHGVSVSFATNGAAEAVMGRTVIMADGGFQSDRTLVARYITRDYVVNGTSMNTGDCLRMATAIGAKTINMEAFYGHIRLRDRLAEPERLFRYPSPREIVNAAMVVDGHGARIGDETIGTPEGVEPIAISIARCDTPGMCWVIFDEATWRTAGVAGAQPMNPTVVDMRGPLVVADSIAQLARGVDVPEPALLESVVSFNRFCRDGTPLGPPRSERAHPIANPPFYALPIITGLTFTMGGLLVNAHAQVLDEQEHPIPGLHAAGGTMGGLQGGPRNGYSGGWSEATTFGLLAAEYATSTLRDG